MRAFAAIAMIFFSASLLVGQTADLILTHGVIYTGKGLAQNHPQTVEALAVSDGKIIASGTNEQILQLKSPHTEIRDLDSLHSHVYVFPAFRADTHLGRSGLARLRADDPSLRSPTPGQLRRAIELAIADELARGVTTVDDFGNLDDYRALLQMQLDGQLNLRITEFLPDSSSSGPAGPPVPDSLLRVAPPSARPENLPSATTAPIPSQLARATSSRSRGRKLAASQANTLLAGQNADFIFIDRDLFKADAKLLGNAQVVETFLAGRQVFLAHVHVQ